MNRFELNWPFSQAEIDGDRAYIKVQPGASEAAQKICGSCPLKIGNGGIECSGVVGIIASARIAGSRIGAVCLEEDSASEAYLAGNSQDY